MNIDPRKLRELALLHMRVFMLNERKKDCLKKPEVKMWDGLIDEAFTKIDKLSTELGVGAFIKHHGSKDVLRGHVDKALDTMDHLREEHANDCGNDKLLTIDECECDLSVKYLLAKCEMFDARLGALKISYS